MNASQERAEVLRIMKETEGNPTEREKRLKKLADNNSIAVGAVCKCDEPKRTFCPRHGRI